MLSEISQTHKASAAHFLSLWNLGGKVEQVLLALWKEKFEGGQGNKKENRLGEYIEVLCMKPITLYNYYMLIKL
jgi:hypothetical protein